MREEAAVHTVAQRSAAAPTFYKSRIARKILVLFVLSALVPLVVFAGLSLHQVSEQLEAQANTRLHESCKAIGMSMVERLHHLRADLALLVDDSQDGRLGLLRTTEGVRQRLETRYEWLALATLDGVALDGTREGQALPSLDDAQRSHLANHGAVLIFRPTDGPTSETLLVVAAGEGGRPDRIVVGSVSAEHLWGGEWVQQPNTEILVLTEDGSEVLFASEGGVPLQAPTRQASASAAASGHFDWRGEEESHLVHYRTMFTRPVFLNSFLVSLSEPRSYVLAPIATFKTLFVLFGLLTLLGVAIASLLQIRRSLAPIVSLHEGTLRVASGSSDEDVAIHSGDEFEDLAQAFNSMAHSIRERTTQLERANQAKSDFLAHMSHELRTPLTAVLGYSELSLCEDASDAERKRTLEVIHRNSTHLLDVVNTILDMSRLEAGESVVRLAPCRPAQVVQQVVEMMEVLAKDKGLEFRTRSDPRIPEWITTDARRMEQVLINVVANAIKFTEAGTVEMHVEWSEGPDRRGPLIFRVTDTGPGIPTDHLEAIFEPFQQVDLSMSRQHGGTGLGLSFSRALARELGGEITCTSELGRGAEFVITIDPGELDATPAPLPSSTEAAVHEDRVEESERRAPDEVGPRRILLAEDVIVNRKMIAAMLKKGGHTVEEAENGRVAFEKATAAASEGRPFDIIFMDMQMPEMDGYEASGRLREAGSRVPVVALTAHSLEGERERCLDAGCDDYATKPIQQATLLELVARHTSTSEVSPGRAE